MDCLTDPAQLPREILLREVGAHLPLCALLRLAQVNREARVAVLADVDARHPAQTTAHAFVEEAFQADARNDTSSGATRIREELYDALLASDRTRWIAIWRAVQAGGRRRLRAVYPLKMFDSYLKKITHDWHCRARVKSRMKQINWLARALCNVYGNLDAPAYSRSVQPRWRRLLQMSVNFISGSHRIPWFCRTSHYTTFMQLAGIDSIVDLPLTRKEQADLVEYQLLHCSPSYAVGRSARADDDDEDTPPPLTSVWRRLWRDLEATPGLVISLYTARGANARHGAAPAELSQVIVDLVRTNTRKWGACHSSARMRASLVRFLVAEYLDRLHRAHYALLPGLRAALHLFERVCWHPVVLGPDLSALRRLLQIVRDRADQPVLAYLRTHSTLERTLPDTVARLLQPSATKVSEWFARVNFSNLPSDGLTVARAIWTLLVDEIGLAPSQDAQIGAFSPVLTGASKLRAKNSSWQLLTDAFVDAAIPSQASAWIRSLPAIRSVHSLAARYASEPHHPDVLCLMHHFATFVAASEPPDDRGRDATATANDRRDDDACLRSLRTDAAWARLGLTHLTDPLVSTTDPQRARLALFRRYIHDRLREEGVWYPPAARAFASRKRPHERAFPAPWRSPKYVPTHPMCGSGAPAYDPSGPTYEPVASSTRSASQNSSSRPPLPSPESPHSSPYDDRTAPRTVDLFLTASKQ